MAQENNPSENMGCLGALFAMFMGAPSRQQEATRQTNEPEVAAPQEAQPETTQELKEAKRESYANCYQRKYLLTKNEWYAHKKLKQIADAKGLIICPKVRLLDILEPRRGEKDYKSLFYKVQAKHVDFLICDQDMKIKAVLELDDNSHDQKNRKDRDSFVDEILTGVGYKVIHTRYINDDILDNLE